MTNKHLVELLVLVMATVPAAAGTLGSDGSVGFSAGYQSNPLLLDTAAGDSESLAMLLYLPVTFTGRRVTLSLQPRLRAASTHGSIAPISDYQYLDAAWDYQGERNEVSADADWRRDSTLYNQYERSELGGNSLRRLEEIGSLSWHHQMTELSGLQAQSSYDRVLYDQDPTHTLNSYSYGQASLKYDHALSARWKLALESGVTRFELRTAPYRTDAEYAQLDVSRDLTERWSLLMSIGMSRLKSTLTVQQLVLVADSHGVLHLVLENVDVVSRQSTANYSFELQRQYERWKLDLSGSRALQPSGFGVLARQDEVSVKVSADWSERCTVSGALHGSRQDDTSGRISLGNRHYYDASLVASWRWSERWTLQTQLSVYLQRVAQTESRRSSTAAFLTLTRDLGRRSLN